MAGPEAQFFQSAVVEWDGGDARNELCEILAYSTTGKL
jgi:hypothetical protein